MIKISKATPPDFETITVKDGGIVSTDDGACMLQVFQDCKDGKYCDGDTRVITAFMERFKVSDDKVATLVCRKGELQFSITDK